MGKQTDIFLHVPKTGGTTLHSVLTFQYLGKLSIWLKPWKQSGTVYERRRAAELDEMSVAEKNNLQMVRGHVYYGVHNKLPKSCSYITFVKNPVKHVRSQYKYFGKISRQNGEESVWTENTFVEILRNDDGPWLDNMQVRWLSGAGLSVDNVTRAHYETAVQNIEKHFAAVGVTEKFDISLILFSEKLGWTRPLFYRRANVQTYEKAEENDQSVLPREEIKDVNRWDMKLYQYALDALAREQPDDIHERVDRLRRNNAVLGPLVDAYRSTKRLARRTFS